MQWRRPLRPAGHPLTALALLLLAACQSAPPAREPRPVPVAVPVDEPVAPAATPASAPGDPAPGASAPEPAPPPVALRPPPPPRPPRIGLALGGGAARGFAHIGAIQVLEEAGIRPDLVVGTSAGSLVAALYASGKSGQEMAAIALALDEGTITDWAFPSRGLIRGEALARYVRQQTGGLTIERMPMPLGIVATVLDSGAAVLFRRGDTGTAVRASSAVPAVFQPVPIAGREYVDGGLVSPVPVRFAREMGAELVVAIDITTPPDGNPTGDSLRLLLQTYAIMGRSIASLELSQADVVLRPVLTGVAGTDFTSRVRALRAGREEAARVLPALKARIAAQTR
ncbi:MAG: patatin-like phospholipase family protein [Rubrivivax sp.]|nr:patatin-like phospholipase family protein [Rubrivivax sp.]